MPRISKKSHKKPIKAHVAKIHKKSIKKHIAPSKKSIKKIKHNSHKEATHIDKQKPGYKNAVNLRNLYEKNRHSL